MRSFSLNALWRTQRLCRSMRPSGYAATPQHRYEQLVEEHAELVRRIAHHLLMRLPPSVQVDDLVQAGMLALLEAAQNYDASRGASFSTYAGIRIRGAMIDEVRRGDWSPRSVHKNARALGEAMGAVERRTGREASESEVAAELGVPLAEYRQMLTDVAGSRLFSFEELLGQDDDGEGSGRSFVDPTSPQPQDETELDRFGAALAAAIDALPEREKLILSLYYDDELNLKEIGAVLGVSESRVSQLHSQAALRLRKRLEGWRIR